MIEEQPGAKCYAFADPTAKIMYLGDEAAYQRLKALMGSQQIKEEHVKDAMYWSLWGKKQMNGFTGAAICSI